MLSHYRKLLDNREYRNVWCGQGSSALGDSVYQVGFWWLAYSMTSSPIEAGAVVFAGSAPYLLFGLAGGAYADRWDRKRIMVVGDLVRAIAVAVVPVWSSVAPVSVWVVAAVAFVLTSVRCFFYPAINATVTDVVAEDARTAAVSFLQAAFQASRIFGTALGGALVVTIGAHRLYWIPACTYLISVFFLLRLRADLSPRGVPASTSALADVLETVRFILPDRDLFWSLSLFGVGLLVITGLDRVALPALSDRVWHVGADGLGMILASFGLGNAIASVSLGHLEIRRYTRVIFGGWGLWGLFYIGIGAAPTFTLAVIAAFLAGASEAAIDVPMVLLIQATVPRQRLGKVFSMWSTVAFAGEAGGSLVAGILVGMIGPAQGYAAAGVGLVLFALMGASLTRAPRGSQIGGASWRRDEK